MKAVHFLSPRIFLRELSKLSPFGGRPGRGRNSGGSGGNPGRRKRGAEAEPVINRFFNYLNNKPIRLKLFVYYFSMFAVATTVGASQWLAPPVCAAT